MPHPRRHFERHRTDRVGWLRAAVLGANDGIVSTASLLVGVAAATPRRATCSSPASPGSSPGDVDGRGRIRLGPFAGRRRERRPVEGTQGARAGARRGAARADRIYVRRGLEPGLALQVAEQLTAHDALGAHARDELGISATLAARPVQAAFASAASFAVGAALPLAVALAAAGRA
jgi:VIT1/CCC1 family predicted Fe2+/Mn2+ transporter